MKHSSVTQYTHIGSSLSANLSNTHYESPGGVFHIRNRLLRLGPTKTSDSIYIIIRYVVMQKRYTERLVSKESVVTKVPRTLKYSYHGDDTTASKGPHISKHREVWRHIDYT